MENNKLQDQSNEMNGQAEDRVTPPVMDDGLDSTMADTQNVQEIRPEDAASEAGILLEKQEEEQVIHNTSSFRPTAQRDVKAKVQVKENIVEDENEETIIHVEGMDFWYGDFQALKNLNVDIMAHQTTALIGPSGCGKSTFLRCLNRMNELIEGTRTEGLISLNGTDINKDVDIMLLRKNVGMVFQKPNPFDMSIYDNIAFGPRIHGMASGKELDALVERCLKKAALWDEVKDRLDDNGLDLSGGQQQRLCIARTLSTNPQIILMDEPTSALDPISTQKVEDLIQELEKEYTVIIVTHNMQQAGRVADKTVFFLNGEIIEADRTDKIFTNPADSRTEEYISGRFG